MGESQGYLTYTYLIANPSDNTIHKIIIDGGNSQVLSILKAHHWNHYLVNQDTQGLDIGRDTMVYLESYGIAYHLDPHLGYHLNLIVIMNEILDHGNSLDD